MSSISRRPRSATRFRPWSECSAHSSFRGANSAVSLTQTGKRFLEEARATLKQAENAELIGKRAARGDIGSIEIGYILSASCIGMVPEMIGDFQRDNPNVSVQIVRMETFPQLKALIDGVLDTRSSERRSAIRPS